MKAFIELLQHMAEKRRMILDLAKSDFRKRFVGSYFGIIWMFLQPLATVTIYAFPMVSSPRRRCRTRAT